MLTFKFVKAVFLIFKQQMYHLTSKKIYYLHNLDQFVSCSKRAEIKTFVQPSTVDSYFETINLFVQSTVQIL